MTINNKSQDRYREKLRQIEIYKSKWSINIDAEIVW